MKKERRMSAIMERLRAEPREWQVNELAGIHAVSPLTIRRTLDELAKKNLILRTHGGCIVANQVADSPYYKKISENFDLKNRIGSLAAKQVCPDESILINDGSTCFHLASNLDVCAPLTVYTNSIAMIPELSRFSGIKTIVLGGEYNRDLFCLVGGMIERMLEMLHFDTVFLGTDGIDDNGRCMICEVEIARMTELMLRRGKKRILLADHTKLNKGGNVTYGSLKDFDMWITTPGVPENLKSKFHSMTNIMEA